MLATDSCCIALAHVQLQALHDQYRIQFYHAYLNNACQAIEKYGLNVKKMFAWTFLDNFEWVSGLQLG